MKVLLLEKFTVEACLPEWFKKGESCPYGHTAGFLGGTFTWPEPSSVQWIDYVAAFYSLNPFLLLLTILLMGLWSRGARELFAFVFFFVGNVVMGVAKLIIQQPRPEGSCSVSCGMPSGHTLTSISFFTWIALEVIYAQSIKSPQKGMILTVAGALLIPVGWSRTVFNDHSWGQVLVGASMGIVLGCFWCWLLSHRFTLWLVKLLKAWMPQTFNPNYPIDARPEEAAWDPRAPGADNYGGANCRS
eukprot:TRINITY_DN32153_c0_g1_i1.p1 TRINITY_DN32153_c0_g1~~TRINITY_DN32153_c0_g1_i1.p1  ORF type:complete len:245 (+),score=24.31 TRINITY_DN32153_c0_g1_i1:80-814(+)